MQICKEQSDYQASGQNHLFILCHLSPNFTPRFIGYFISQKQRFFSQPTRLLCSNQWFIHLDWFLFCSSGYLCVDTCICWYTHYMYFIFYLCDHDKITCKHSYFTPKIPYIQLHTHLFESAFPPFTFKHRFRWNAACTEVNSISLPSLFFWPVGQWSAMCGKTLTIDCEKFSPEHSYGADVHHICFHRNCDNTRLQGDNGPV